MKGAKKYYKKLRKFLLANLPGLGGAYVIGILGLIMAASYLISGGLLPDIELNPKDPQHVEIDDTSINTNKDTLQLVNIQAKPSPTPEGGGGTPGIGTPTPGNGTPGAGTPTPTPGGGIGTPTPTRPPQACLENTAIDLLVDLSHSMVNNGKDDALRAALQAFRLSLSDNTYVGIQVFGSPSSFPNGAQEKLVFTRYGSNKTRVTNAITNLTPGDYGGTYMRAGFSLALSKIRQTKQELDGYRFVTILFSDGVPEVNEAFGPDECVADARDADGNYKCFAKAQDPRRFGLDVDMKDEVSKVYSVAIYDDTPGSLDEQLIDPLKDLLKDVASGRSSPYYQDTTIRSPEQLTSIFQSIVNRVCE